MNINNTYNSIFKSTALFAFVQVFRSVIGVVKNKIIALLLGADGMGLIGIYDSIIFFMQTLAGIGVKQSAVKDISEVNKNYYSFSRIISLVNKLTLFTAFIGGVITLLFSNIIGDSMLGSGDHTIVFIVLSFVIFFNIVNEGKLAILKGMRRLRLLAYANMIGVVVSLIVSAPLYFFLNDKGILPVFIISSSIGLFVSSWFVNRIDYKKINLTFKELYLESSPMIKMGLGLMFVTLLDAVVSLIIVFYIKSVGGVAEVGLYNAGRIIISSYFGILITALVTDYYPRISEINMNNNQLEIELNKQSLMSIVLLAPLFVFFLFLLPFFIEILYTNEFLPAIEYIKYGIYGTLITICSNQVDLILVAKQKVKVFTFISFVYRALQLTISIYLYNIWGLSGLGITIIIVSLFHLIAMSLTVYVLYRIRFSNKFIAIALIVLVFALLSSYFSSIQDDFLKYLFGTIISICSLLFSLFLFKKLFNINLVSFIKNKF